MRDDEHAGDDDFATVLRNAVRRRGMSLRTLQQRLRDRGHEVSVAALSHWQSGARIPGTDASADVVHELEDLLRLDDGVLAGKLVPRRRVPADGNVPFASFVGLEHNEVTDESAPRQLSERSSTLMTYVDAEGLLSRNLARNVWQARVDGAREVAVFVTVEPGETQAPGVRAVLGCDLVDVVVDMEQRVIRPMVRLKAPLRRGELVMTEWETFDHRYADDAISEIQSLVAVRREAEVGVFIYFDDQRLPRRCWATTQQDGVERSFPVSLIGGCASHIEFDFGPGSIAIEWEW